MEINFTAEQNSKTLTFGEVMEDQFFVNKDGLFCQKVSSDFYTIIADEEGIPMASFYDNVTREEKIKRLLPEVTKINF
jgi:hypothetical protein